MNNVLICGDLHSPFDLPQYFQFCKETYSRYKCNRVIFIGDIIDLHTVSVHDSNPDGLGQGNEIDKAIKRLQRWYKAFPKATVLLGNHDLRIAKKAYREGLSKRFIRDFNEVIEAPKGWSFEMEYVLDNVLYLHGSLGNSFIRCQRERMNLVQGHFHSIAGVQYFKSNKDMIWGMQVGSGIDDTAYAFDYGKEQPKKSIISCGLVLNNGKLPIVIPM
jgi:hypothetical protein